MKELLFQATDGKIMTVDASEAAVAARAGWKPVTQPEADAYLAQQTAKTEAESFTGKLKTAGEGLASGALEGLTAPARLATAGFSKLTGAADPFAGISGRGFLSDVAAVGGGAEAGSAYDDAQRLRAETNPLTAGASSVAGQIAGAAAGGLGSVARGAGAAAAKAGGAGVLGRLGGAAVAGAIEGAPLGLAAESDAAYVENRQLTGEQALAAGGIGALLGGSLSFAAHGAGEALGAVKGRTSSALEDVMNGGPAKAPPSDASAIRKVLGATDEKITQQGARTLGEEPLPGFAEHVRAAVSGKNMGELRAATHAQAAESLTKELQTAITTSNDIGDEVFSRAAKRSHVEANFARGGVAPDALEQSASLAGGIINDLDAAARDVDAFGAPSKVFDGLRKQVAKQVLAIGKAETETDAYMAVDQIRRDLLSASKSFGTSAAKVADVDAAANMSALAEKVGEHYESSFKFLMDPGTWGAQGAAQQEVNNAAAKYIEAKRFAFPHFAEKVGESYAGPGRFVPTFEVNDGKILNLVRKAGTQEGAFAERRFQQYLDASRQFSEAVAGGYELTPELAAKVKSLGTGTEAAKKTFDAAMAKVGALNQADLYMNAVKQQSGAHLPAIMGGIVGGPAGAAIGAVADGFINPARSMAQRIAIDQAAERSRKLVGSALDGVFARSQNVASSAFRLAPKAGEAVSRAAVPTALATFIGKHATPEQAYEARVNELYSAQQNAGGSVRDAIGNAFGEHATQDAEALTAMTVAATTGVNYLLSKIPSGLYQQNTLTPLTSKTIPSRGEIASFARTYAAVMKPSTVLADMKAGKVSRDQIDAYKTVYPRAYEDLRTSALQRIRDMDQRGKSIPMRTRAELDTILNLNGAGERTMTNEFSERYATLLSDASATKSKQQEQARRPRPGPTNIGKSLQTKTATFLGGA